MIHKIKEISIKVSEFSSIVEQNLEETLSELISNNYKPHELNFYDLVHNETSEIFNEINELTRSVLTLYRNKISIKNAIWQSFRKQQDDNSEDLILNVMRLIRFSNILKNTSNSLVLINYNINELYHYPIFSKQGHIPDFALTVSSFFKENIDIFFQKNHNTSTTRIITAKLKKIVSLSHKILNEFSIDILGRDINIDAGENQVIYYSNIVSYLKLISIDALTLALI